MGLSLLVSEIGIMAISSPWSCEDYMRRYICTVFICGIQVIVNFHECWHLEEGGLVLCLDWTLLEPSFMSSIIGSDKGIHSIYEIVH